MKIYAPSYYNKFKCIANRCKHNCCIGWEIDVDERTMELYSALKGETGERIRSNIDSGDVPHFRLQKNERCPFLNCDNLCDIISELGESYLCQICDDHPRFRNYFDLRIEMGLGLCCEAACELVLNDSDRFTLIEIGEEESSDNSSESEAQFFKFRESIFDIISNQDFPLKDRINELLKYCNITFPKKLSSYWADVFLDLERLNPLWDKYLMNLKESSLDIADIEFDNQERSCMNLLNYFIYRYLGDCIYCDDLKERILFCVLSLYIIHSIYKLNGDLIDISRMYSAEIEYSDENVNRLLTLLSSYT